LGLRSKSDIHRLVTGLVQRGYIDYVRYRARSIRVLGEGELTVKVTPEQLEFLRAQAAEFGEPIEDLVGAIIENWIDQATGGEPT
jgi:SOS-response transcriptional repressor LexA